MCHGGPGESLNGLSGNSFWKEPMFQTSWQHPQGAWGIALALKYSGIGGNMNHLEGLWRQPPAVIRSMESASGPAITLSPARLLLALTLSFHPHHNKQTPKQTWGGDVTCRCFREIKFGQRCHIWATDTANFRVKTPSEASRAGCRHTAARPARENRYGGLRLRIKRYMISHLGRHV